VIFCNETKQLKWDIHLFFILSVWGLNSCQVDSYSAIFNDSDNIIILSLRIFFYHIHGDTYLIYGDYLHILRHTFDLGVKP